MLKCAPTADLGVLLPKVSKDCRHGTLVVGLLQEESVCSPEIIVQVNGSIQAWDRCDEVDERRYDGRNERDVVWIIGGTEFADEEVEVIIDWQGRKIGKVRHSE